MHILLDNIASFLVAGVLFVTIFAMMHRNSQNAVELTVNNMVHEQAYDFLKIIERDLENIRSTGQAQDAGADPLCNIEEESIVQDTIITTNTKSIIFPTYIRPIDGTPDRTVSVRYVREDPVKEGIQQPDSVFVNDRYLRLYNVIRYEKFGETGTVDYAGESGPIITNFSIEMFDNNGDLVECADEGMLGRTRVEFQAAVDPVEYQEQQSIFVNNKTTRFGKLNVSRFGATVYSANR